ncbi:unnamed protein product, partial [Amoebophrya sp. A120]|eukprot:GSA120T00012747001.1
MYFLALALSIAVASVFAEYPKVAATAMAGGVRNQTGPKHGRLNAGDRKQRNKLKIASRDQETSAHEEQDDEQDEYVYDEDNPDFGDEDEQPWEAQEHGGGFPVNGLGSSDKNQDYGGSGEPFRLRPNSGRIFISGSPGGNPGGSGSFYSGNQQQAQAPQELELKKLPKYKDQTSLFYRWINLAMQKYPADYERILDGLEARVENSVALSRWMEIIGRDEIAQMQNAERKLKAARDAYKEQWEQGSVAASILESYKQQATQKPSNFHDEFMKRAAKVDSTQVPVSEQIRIMENNALGHLQAAMIMLKPGNMSEVAEAVSRADKLHQKQPPQKNTAGANAQNGGNQQSSFYTNQNQGQWQHGGNGKHNGGKGKGRRDFWKKKKGKGRNGCNNYRNNYQNNGGGGWNNNYNQPQQGGDQNYHAQNANWNQQQQGNWQNQGGGQSFAVQQPQQQHNQPPQQQMMIANQPWNQNQQPNQVQYTNNHPQQQGGQFFGSFVVLEKKEWSFAASQPTGTQERNQGVATKWVLLDSGSSRHLTGDLELVHEHRNTHEELITASDAAAVATGVGKMVGQGFECKDTLFVPSLGEKTVLSMPKLLAAGIYPNFQSGTCMGTHVAQFQWKDDFALQV